jgi:hypothetical protein
MRPAIAPDGRTLVSPLVHVDVRVAAARPRHRCRPLARTRRNRRSMASATRDLLPRAGFQRGFASLYLNDDGHLVRIASLLARNDATVHGARRHDAAAARTHVDTPAGRTGPRAPDPGAGTIARRTTAGILGAGARLRDAARGPRAAEATHAHGKPGISAVVVTRRASACVRNVDRSRRRGLDRERGRPRRAAPGHAHRATTQPGFPPDGQSLFVLRSSNAVRMHSRMEYGALRGGNSCACRSQADRAGARDRVDGREAALRAGRRCRLRADEGRPHAVRLDGSGERLVVNVTGPGWYFSEGRYRPTTCA